MLLPVKIVQDCWVYWQLNRCSFDLRNSWPKFIIYISSHPFLAARVCNNSRVARFLLENSWWVESRSHCYFCKLGFLRHALLVNSAYSDSCCKHGYK